MNPERIGVRDFVEPLCIRAARVNLHRETEGRDQNRLSFLEIVFMDVTLEVSGYRELGPTPIAQRRRIELQPSARRRKAALDFAIDLDAGQAASIFVAIRKRERNDVWPRGFPRA